jgi:hypothetical protein
MHRHNLVMCTTTKLTRILFVHLLLARNVDELRKRGQA